MPACKYCDDEIEWYQKGDGEWRPLNLDGTAHNCRRKTRKEPTPAPEPWTPYRTLYLRDDAPPEVVQAAYRALAKKYHPDAGGSEQQMKVLNAAYEQITSR